jgi:hypothetical protein
MGGVLYTLNPDLIEMEQEERIAALCKEFERRERLALAGYQPPAARARATLAACLLRLAVLLDERIASRVEPAAALEARTA